MTTKEVLIKIDDKERLRHHPILVIGGTGNVGLGLQDSLVHELGTKSVISASRNSGYSCDITDSRSISKLIEHTRPSAIFHLAAATDVDRCEREPEWAWEVNFEGTRNVLKAAKHIPVIMFSTDFVFDGETAIPKKEMDQPNPVNEYGQSKHAAECLFLDSGNPGFIARISYPWYSYRMHTYYPTTRDTPYWMAKLLVEGKEVSAFDNAIGNWTPMDYLHHNMLTISKRVIENDIRLIHLGGNSHTPYEVAKALGKSLYGTDHITSRMSAIYGGDRARRPESGGLDTSLAKSLGLDMPDIIEEIESGKYFN